MGGHRTPQPPTVPASPASEASPKTPPRRSLPVTGTGQTPSPFLTPTPSEPTTKPPSQPKDQRESQPGNRQTHRRATRRDATPTAQRAPRGPKAPKSPLSPPEFPLPRTRGPRPHASEGLRREAGWQAGARVTAWGRRGKGGRTPGNAWPACARARAGGQHGRGTPNGTAGRGGRRRRGAGRRRRGWGRPKGGTTPQTPRAGGGEEGPPRAPGPPRRAEGGEKENARKAGPFCLAGRG